MNTVRAQVKQMTTNRLVYMIKVCAEELQRRLGQEYVDKRGDCGHLQPGAGRCSDCR